jgi:23S rRNA (uracil1939-C5)-methyltransferase
MPELKKNDIYTATCTGYTSEGMGIVRIDGRVVFVKDLLNGEMADIRIIKAGKNAVYGKIEKIYNMSFHRTDAFCDVYGKCGGCAVRHMDYEEELNFKRQRVDDAFKRIGGLELCVDEILGAKTTEGYRNKTIYTVGKGENGTVTGFYKVRSHDLVPAPDCAIESDYSRRAAKALRFAMNALKIPVFDEKSRTGVRRLMCRYGFKSGQGQIVLITGNGNIPHQEKLIDGLLKSCPETVSIMRNINPNPGDTVMTHEFTTLWGQEYMEDELCDLNFRLAPDAFYQVNRDQAEILYNRALDYAELTGEETALDLYCGTGTITLCLAKRAKTVIGAEIVESAIENAKKNAERNGVENAKFICADAGEAAERLKKEGFTPDVIVVDPPRKGLLPEVPPIIASMNPKRIVYVSCDPATLARDLKIFQDLGYKATKATATDMFPRTHHVETVVLMSRVKE